MGILVVVADTSEHVIAYCKSPFCPASKITQELAALTGQVSYISTLIVSSRSTLIAGALCLISQVRPRDVVSVQALHQAIGITAHPTEKPHSPAEQKQNSPEAILSRQSE